jgi:sugar lactone lactonase YvrE
MNRYAHTACFRFATAALMTMALGCSEDDATAPAPTGSMVVTLSSRAGVTPSALVTGPASYAQRVSATTNFGYLPSGRYTITADSVMTPDPVVGFTVDTVSVTGSPAVVEKGGTAQATATFALARRYGALWMANNGSSKVSGFAASQLAATATVAPANTIDGTAASAGVAFDANGNMWVSSYASDTLRMYTVAQRSAGGSPAPAVTLVSPALSSAQQLAFDNHGNLWVADYQNGLLEFSAAQLAAGGSAVTPTVVLTDPSVGMAGMFAVTFDGAGNAWVAEYAANRLVEYTASALGVTGSPTPAVTISAVSRSLASPCALAFDSHGNLWVANVNNASVAAYTPTQLAVTGSPAPAIALIAGGRPFGVAFDASGSLWVSDTYGRLLKYTAAQLVASGMPTPAVALAVDPSVRPDQLAFDRWIVPSTSPSGSPARVAMRHR